MTISSTLWVTSPLSPRGLNSLWEGGRDLIHRLSPSDLPPATFRDVPLIDPYYPVQPGTRERGHHLGQGFCAIYEVTYQLLGLPVQTGDPALISHEECDSPCENSHAEQRFPYWVQISLDTEYGYPNAGGLHALIFSIIGRALDTSAVSWCWTSDILTEIYQGTDERGFAPLIAAMDQASSWFSNEVLPAIGAMYR